MQQGHAEQALIPSTQFLNESEDYLDISDENMQRIYFLRHGESALNGSASNGIKYIQGQNLLVPLTEKGIAQARSLANQIKHKFPKSSKYIICSSVALRATQTAQTVFENVKDELTCSLGKQYANTVEQSHANWEGKPRDDAYLAIMTEWNKRSANDKFRLTKFEGGESPEAVSFRAMKDLQEMVVEYPDYTIIHVIHNNALNALAFWKLRYAVS